MCVYAYLAKEKVGLRFFNSSETVVADNDDNDDDDDDVDSIRTHTANNK